MKYSRRKFELDAERLRRECAKRKESRNNAGDKKPAVSLKSVSDEDHPAGTAASMLRGQLRKVPANVLVDLKRELSEFDENEKLWKS